MQNMPICRCRCHDPWLHLQLFFDKQARCAGCCPAVGQKLSHGHSHRISTGDLWKRLQYIHRHMCHVQNGKPSHTLGSTSSSLSLLSRLPLRAESEPDASPSLPLLPPPFLRALLSSHLQPPRQPQQQPLSTFLVRSGQQYQLMPTAMASSTKNEMR